MSSSRVLSPLSENMQLVLSSTRSRVCVFSSNSRRRRWKSSSPLQKNTTPPGRRCWRNGSSRRKDVDNGWQHSFAGAHHPHSTLCVCVCAADGSLYFFDFSSPYNIIRPCIIIIIILDMSFRVCVSLILSLIIIPSLHVVLGHAAVTDRLIRTIILLRITSSSRQPRRFTSRSGGKRAQRGTRNVDVISAKNEISAKIRLTELNSSQNLD